MLYSLILILILGGKAGLGLVLLLIFLALCSGGKTSTFKRHEK